MNPAIAIAAKNAWEGTKKALSNKYVRIALILIALIFLFRRAIGSMIEKIRENIFNKKEHKDVNLLAQQYREALNPSGADWMIDFDGSDEPAIERLAYQTKGFLKEVSEAYRLKYNEGLVDRLRKELSAEELQNWRNIVT